MNMEFENRVLRRTFGPTGDEVTESSIMKSFFIIRMVKSRRMRWAGHEARMGRLTHLGYWWISQKESDHLEDQEVDG
jgi:hypothetical protein